MIIPMVTNDSFGARDFMSGAEHNTPLKDK